MEQQVGRHTLHTCTRAHTCTRTPTFTPPLSASPVRIRKAFSAEDELDNYSVTPAPNFSVFVLGHNWEFLLGSQLGSFSDWHCLCTSPRDSPLPELRSPHSPAEPDKSFPQRVCLRLRITPPKQNTKPEEVSPGDSKRSVHSSISSICFLPRSQTLLIYNKHSDQIQGQPGGAIAPKTPNDWTTMIRHSHLPP